VLEPPARKLVLSDIGRARAYTPTSQVHLFVLKKNMRTGVFRWMNIAVHEKTGYWNILDVFRFLGRDDYREYLASPEVKSLTQLVVRGDPGVVTTIEASSDPQTIWVHPLLALALFTATAPATATAATHGPPALPAPPALARVPIRYMQHRGTQTDAPMQAETADAAAQTDPVPAPAAAAAAATADTLEAEMARQTAYMHTLAAMLLDVKEYLKTSQGR
jgi:hypothetical protein